MEFPAHFDGLCHSISMRVHAAVEDCAYNEETSTTWAIVMAGGDLCALRRRRAVQALVGTALSMKRRSFEPCAGRQISSASEASKEGG
ncbi:MAG TPA: hypothetical protein VN692_04825 [Steroidobacteraceae bacterium]|nr:hypothetical protein [Steroidobacteraceae bacterium]